MAILSVRHLPWPAILASIAFRALAGGDPPASVPPHAGIRGAAIEIKGRLVPDRDDHRGGMNFKTDTGSIYSLVSNQMSTALFVDTNLQAKTLLLKGRLVTGPNRFEVTGNLHSVRNGKVHELYYYCDICSIKGSDPGPCMCCREPVHLVEEPK